VTRIELRERVKQWHATVPTIYFEPEDGEQDHNARQTRTLGEIATGLGNALQLPSILARLPQRVTALTIIPDDILHGFPFAAMPHGDRYWVERFSLGIGFESLPGQPAPRPALPKTALLVSVAEADETADHLVSAQREVGEIAPPIIQAGWQVEYLREAAASKEALLKRLPDTGLFHIASHGVFEPGQPDQSGFVLASEVLSLREIAALDLRSLRHATLSSCWSADNFILPGRWIISVPEAFYRAGAGSVLGALWEVPDELAVDFMAQFYRNLKRHRRDKALQLAQIDCLRKVSSGSANVRFWANFNLYGNCGRLKP
jgi:CHAT domain-containing protein